MRWKSLRLFLFLGIILLLGVFAWFWQANQLPFQRADPFAAVGTSQPLLLLLPDTVSEEVAYPWSESWQRRNRLLDSLGLGAAVSWENWWLLPARGEGSDAVYTFIGEAKDGLAKHWDPSQYGPTLPFGGGEIYTFAYTQAEEVYFARYRNLFLIGLYPFQLEAALRRLNEEEDSWAMLPEIKRLHPPKSRGGHKPEIWMYPPALTVDLPTNWLSPSALRHWQQWKSIRLSFTEVQDSTARLNWRAVATAPANYQTTVPWIFIPPNVAFVSLVPRAKVATSADLENVWAMRLPVAISTEASTDPNLWLAAYQDTAAWTKLRQEAELIDFENYQTYRLEQWRSFSPLSEWTGRRGALQAWTLRVDEWVIVALEREVLERWLDFYLLGANLALEPHFGTWLAEDEASTTALLSWSADTSLPVLALLFPKKTWSERAIVRIMTDSQNEAVIAGRAAVRFDWRKPRGIRLLWTAPLAGDIDSAMPLYEVGAARPNGLLLKHGTNTAQLYRASGIGPRLAIPEGMWIGKGYQLSPEEEERFLLTTTTGVYQVRASREPDELPGTIGLAAAAPIELQSHSRDWEWLYLDRQGGLRIGQANGQILASWSLKQDSLSGVSLHWWRGVTEERIVLGSERTAWQAYSKAGELQWEAPFPSTTIAGAVGGWDTPADPRLYLPLVDGSIQVLNQDGDHFFLRAGRGPVDHALVGEWWGDERSDVILQRGKLIHLFGYADNSFSERWQQRLAVVPDTLLSAGSLGILAVHEATQQVWLLNGEGEVWPGFPIAGSAHAQLVRGADGKDVLLVVSDDELYAYDLSK